MKTEILKSILRQHGEWLRGVVGEKADLSGADLSRADLSRADLSRADLSRANLHRANLHRADLSRANLHRANLHRADLSRANLRGANLIGADLRWANLHEADLGGADLGGANLRGADLSQSCLDPAAKPSGATWPSWDRHGDFVLAFRTRNRPHQGGPDYADGVEYVAPVFSVCQHTECHPGLYIKPTAESVRNEFEDPEVIRVCVLASDVQESGKKARCRKFTVLGEAKGESE